MNETQNNQSGKWTILGLIALIAALFVGIKLIFAGLGTIAPPEPDRFKVLADEAGEDSAYGLRLLTEEERGSGDIQKWLENSQEWMDMGHADKAGSAFWLYRQDTDEYVLYLPGQDRVLTHADITATEEKEEDGERALVLRARTPEGSEETAPREQLFCLRTLSESWRGVRVRVILDGRERDVYKLASKDGKLYSTEELYIGRDI